MRHAAGTAPTINIATLHTNAQSYASAMPRLSCAWLHTLARLCASSTFLPDTLPMRSRTSCRSSLSERGPNSLVRNAQ